MTLEEYYNKIKAGIFTTNPGVQLGKHIVDSWQGGDKGFFPTRLLAGSDVTDLAAGQHLLNKEMDWGDGLAGYMDESLDGYVPVSDATGGYHYRSGKDFANLASGNLPLGGIPAALGGHAYQQLNALYDRDGTFGKNAYLQATDNMMGLIGSGKAPGLKSLYDFGGKLHDIWNKPYEPLYDYSGKIDNKNIFNQGTIEVEDYTTKKNRVLAEREAERQRLAKIAEQQRLAKIAEQQKIDFQQRINPVANIPQSEYQTKMDDVYKNVVVDNSGNRGYTGTGTQSRAGIRNTPAYRGQQAAAAVDRKAKSMGVASPVRRTPGTKYGFGL